MESSTIKTKLNEIWIDNEGILRVKAVAEGEMDLEEAIECFSVYKKLGCDKKKVLQLIDLSIYVTITKEAREYVDTMGPKFFITSAILSDSLPVRILVNFFVKFFQPKVPIKMFSTETEALEWLRNIAKNKPDNKDYSVAV